MEIPDQAWADLVEWFESFGAGPAGLIALAMVLLAFVAWRCLPGMWKSWLDYKKTDKELTLKTRRLDLEIAKKVEKITDQERSDQ